MTDPTRIYFALPAQRALVDTLSSLKKLLQELRDAELSYVDPVKGKIGEAIVILDLAIQNAGSFNDFMSSVPLKMFLLFHIFLSNNAYNNN